MGNDVDAWVDSLSPETRQMIDRLRQLVGEAAPELGETIKWNAPNFNDAGEDRVTLGLERKGGVRMVLHRGAAVRDAAGFGFDDPDGLAKWPSPDRGVMTLANLAEIESQGPALVRLVRRWIDANRQA